MKNKFSKRTNYISSSEIREILKVTQNPEIISFAGGLPAPELFPVNQIKEICNEILTKHGSQALQYSTTEGYKPLRTIIRERMKTIGIASEEDNIIITTGSQQAIDICGKMFIDEGDKIICESPTYLAALTAFKAYMPQILEAPMDEEGMIISELEKILEENPDVKLIYTIPDFQNPTGRTMSLNRRKKLVELANKFDLIIMEDNPYGAIRFSGEPLPPVKHFDTEGRVIYSSSFSKILCPGFRLGWISADTELVKKFVPFKQMSDVHSDIFAQMVTSRYMELHDMDAHIEKIKKVYKHRMEIMIDCINKEFPKGVKHTLPEGGLFIWIELPSNLDSNEIFKKSIKNNVAFVPGLPFFSNRNNKSCFRLNYSNMPDDRIKEGIKRLGKVLKEELE